MTAVLLSLVYVLVVIAITATFPDTLLPALPDGRINPETDDMVLECVKTLLWSVYGFYLSSHLLFITGVTERETSVSQIIDNLEDEQFNPCNLI